MFDKVLENLIKQEKKRQKETLNLIASENIVSKSVLKALGSELTNKYSEGYPKKRYYAGNRIIDKIEILTQERARKVFKLNKNWHINVQPYSGSSANQAIYYALLKPGEKIMGMGLNFGGHLTHGSKFNFSGYFYKTVQYGVNKNGFLDYNEIEKLAEKEKPKIIVTGYSSYPRIIDFKKFRKIADKINAYLMADVSHIAGLIAAGVHPSPFNSADIVMTTTHKTLRGPRGAIIFANRQSPIAEYYKIDIASAIDKAVFPGLQGGPHNNQIAAIAACLYEVLQPSFKKYSYQVVKNAKVLAEELKKFGFDLVSGSTDNHLILINLTNLKISGLEAQNLLEKAGIIVNRNIIPYDVKPPANPSGIRLGTPTITSRGMKEKEAKKIAELIYRLLIKKEKPAIIKKEVKNLCRRFPFLF